MYVQEFIFKYRFQSQYSDTTIIVIIVISPKYLVCSHMYVQEFIFKYRFQSQYSDTTIIVIIVISPNYN